MIQLNVYGIKIKILTKDKELVDFINQYYQIFLDSSLSWLDSFDVIIDIEKYSYFSSRKKISWIETFTHFWDYVSIDRNWWKYYFINNEISALVDCSWDTILIKGIFQPLFIRHWLNVALQWFSRIRKYYNRFIIKTLIHDIVFILLEQKNNIAILHATAVTNWDKTFIFTWLGWSWKSTLASAFLIQKGFTILSDNYCLVHENKIYPFPELPRITDATSSLLGLKNGKKADGIKTYVDNPLNEIKDSYLIDAIFFASYGKDFSLEKIIDEEYIFNIIASINNYTKEFPEYLNLSLLSFLGKFNTNKKRINNLELFIQKNNFYIIENNDQLSSNLNKILNV